MATAKQVSAAFQACAAVAEAIREAKEIPSGTLYAMLMGHMSLETYQGIIRTLKGAGLVAERAHLLSWCGPAIDRCKPGTEFIVTGERRLEVKR